MRHLRESRRLASFSQFIKEATLDLYAMKTIPLNIFIYKTHTIHNKTTQKILHFSQSELLKHW